MSTFRIKITALLFIIYSAINYANPTNYPDSLKSLSAIDGVDMTYYMLYQENINIDEAKAMSYAEQFISKIDSSAVNSTLAALYIHLSEYHAYTRFKYNIGVHFRAKALNIYSELNDLENKAETNFQLAVLHMYLEQYHKTLVHTIDALSFYEDSLYTNQTLECYNLLGIVYNTCGEQEKSSEYFEKYLVGAKLQKDDLKMIYALHNIFCANPNDSTKNKTILEEISKLSKRITDTAQLVKLYLNMSDYALEADNIEHSKLLLSDIKPHLKTLDDFGTYYLVKGSILQEEKDYDLAIENINLALDYLLRGELRKKQQKCYGALQKLYAIKGDFQMAFNSLTRYNELDKSRQTDSVYLQLFRIENQYKELSLESELKRKRISTFTTIASIMLLFIFISSIVVFFLKKKTTELKQKEKIIKSKNENIEVQKLQQFQISRLTEEMVNKLYKVTQDTRDKSTKDQLDQRMKS